MNIRRRTGNSVTNAMMVIVILFLVGAVSAGAKRKMDTFGANMHRTGVYQTKGVHKFTAVKWKFKIGGEKYFGPAVANQTVYVGGSDGKLYAINAATGKKKWHFDTGKRISSTPTVSGGAVYFGSFDGYLYCINARTGKAKWRFGGSRDIDWSKLSPAVARKVRALAKKHSTGLFLSSPAVTKRLVIAQNIDRKIYILDKRTGRMRWYFDSKRRMEGSPAVHGGTVYFGGLNGYLYAMNAKTSAEKWRLKVGKWVRSSPALVGGMVYIGDGEGRVSAVDAKTGKLKWKFMTGKEIHWASPAVYKGVVYICSGDGYIYALNAGTGKLVWKRKGGGSNSSPVVADGIVYFGAETLVPKKSMLRALDAKTGKLKWQFKARVAGAPNVNNGVVYFASMDGWLYAIK